MLNFVIFGPPGAGKGTQSAKLVEKYQLIHLSTGDILRGEITAGTILGQEAKLLMDQGILVPDEIVITMINNKLQQNTHAKGFIFDGFPRTTAQAEALDRLLTAKGTGIGMTLALDISEEELIRRIIQRGTELGRTDDQETDTIKKRIAEYTNKTAPLRNYYTKQRKFHSISGIGSIDEIFHALCSNIDSFYHLDQLSTAVPEHVAVRTLTPLLEVAAPAVAKKAVKEIVPAKKAVKPAGKPAAKKKVSSRKAAKPAAKNRTKPAAKKRAKPTAKKIAKPTAKKIAKPAAKKKTKPAAKKKEKPAAKKIVKPSPKKMAKPAAKKKISKKITVKKKTAPKKKKVSVKKTAPKKKKARS